MKIDEFMEATKEIENFYQKEISEEQKKIWFNELKGLTLQRYKYIISQIYRSCKFLPKLADIIEINTNLGYNQIQKEDNIKNCKKCNNTGYILYWKKIKNGEKYIDYEYMAVCDCKRQKQYKGWEISENRYKNNYYIPLKKEIEVLEETK